MKVAVVGLGPAGAYCCKTLASRGVTVHGYDARDRVGGRTLTVDLCSNLKAEMGAEWIDADMKRVLGWLKSVGIRPAESGGTQSAIWIKDQWADNIETWPDVANFEALIDATTKKLAINEWGITAIQSVIDKAGLTQRAKTYAEMYCRLHFGDEPSRVSVAGWYGEGIRDKGSLNVYRVNEGFQEAVRRTLDSIPIFLNWECKQSEEGLIVTDGVETRKLDQYDKVILALPLTQLLRFTGLTSVSSPSGMSTLKMTRVSKLALGFDSPWWSQQGWNGIVMSDKVFQRIYPQQDRSVLCCFTAGNDAEALHYSPDPVSEVIEVLAQRFPAIKSHFVSGKFISWTHDNWTHGGYAFEAAEKPLSSLQELEDKTGAVICGEFAGGEWIGYVEGALKTAELAIAKVLT